MKNLGTRIARRKLAGAARVWAVGLWSLRFCFSALLWLATASSAAAFTMGNEDIIENISLAIQQTGGAGSSARFDLASLVPFPWDSLQVISPGTDAAAIKTLLGPAGDSFKPPHAAVAESVAWLVFVKDKKVIKVLEFPRVLGDFTPLAGHTAFTPSAAKLQVETNEQVPGWYSVKSGD